MICGLGEEHIELRRGEEEVIEGKVSNDGDKEYLVRVVPSIQAVRIHSKVILLGMQHPVVFLIRTGNTVKSWRIPSITSGNSSEYSSTLCNAPDEGNDNIHNWISNSVSRPAQTNHLHKIRVPAKLQSSAEAASCH